MRLINMDAKDLQIAQLKALLERKDAELSRVESQLQSIQSQHAATTDQFSRSLEEKNQQIEQLELHIKRLLRTIRGSRQERINPDQLLLFSETELKHLADELEQAQKEAAAKKQSPEPEQTEERNRLRSGGRRPLPQHLPREVKRYELSEAERVCPCCGELRQEIDIEKSEQLDFVPGVWKVIEHQRVKYACKGCEEHVALAPKPPQPIEKGVPAPGLCARVVLSKFGDHLPLYREEDLSSRAGWLIRRSTICGWLYDLAILAEPLVMRMKHLILQSKVIHTDDTKIKMIEPQICREAKFWPYQGDWQHPYVVYDFTLDRSRNGPQKFLTNYQGYLQADAFSDTTASTLPARSKKSLAGCIRAVLV